MNAPIKEKSGRAKVKKPYQSPRLVVYGDLKSITAAQKASTSADGALIATRK